jgi:hypothetical protein
MSVLYVNNVNRIQSLRTSIIDLLPDVIAAVVMNYLIFNPQIGDKIIAIDQDGKELPARVISKSSPTTVKVHFIRWSTRYDIDVDYNLTRPFQWDKPILGCKSRGLYRLETLDANNEIVKILKEMSISENAILATINAVGIQDIGTLLSYIFDDDVSTLV